MIPKLNDTQTAVDLTLGITSLYTSDGVAEDTAMFARAETRLAFLVHSRSICVMTHSCLSVCGQSVSTLFLPPSFLAEVA